MSTVIVSAGSEVNSVQDQETGWPTAPPIAKLHSSVDVRGVGPADSTGKSLTTYCPGGTRDGSTSGRRRPWNPREIGTIRPGPAEPPAKCPAHWQSHRQAPPHGTRG